MGTKDDGPQNGGEIIKPDFERAIKVITNDLNPLLEKSAKVRGDQAAGWKVIEDDCHCNKKAAKHFHALMRMDPELRDDYFRTLRGLLDVSGLGISRDLVDEAEGKEASPVIPVVDKSRPELATVN
ncbi:hypothetical protein CVO77_00330 [Sphingopyxis lindanitolerans]|uniref:Uncharacterized protein n=1 Tax=Sphingopyxis lindanitolerans TaxID=2054227 RepID=A0A2S8BAS2_9SPHN|nr:hypothetical protein [Sphingopyxis lindanitolerans]PQM29420.1 hypothetical protein CVO77_00330 [Sphingopyxis lindanitolerans]